MGRSGREFANQLGARRHGIPRPVGRVGVAQHHLEQDQGPRRLDRRGDQARDHDRAVSKDGSKLKPPMGFHYYATMTDGDLNDVIAYLRTVPAKE